MNSGNYNAQWPRSPIVHWMNIGIEESWKENSPDFLPKFKQGYDNKIYDSERLSLFWAKQQDCVILRTSPPEAWLQHLVKRDIELPQTIVLNKDIAYIDASDAQCVFENGKCCSEILPYVVTDDIWTLSKTKGIPVLGADPALVKELNNKTKQRQLLEQIGIPVPQGRIFETNTELITYIKTNPANEIMGNVIKLPFGASGQGMFRIVCEQNIQQLSHMLSRRPEANAVGGLVFERWYNVTNNLNYQLVLEEGKETQLTEFKEQLLDNGIFKGFIYPAELERTTRENLEKYANKIGKFLYQLGCRGVVSIDAIVTEDGEIFPAVDINMRFSLSTYFQPYLSTLDGRFVKVHYVDINIRSSVETIVELVETVSIKLAGNITIASISDIGVGQRRRIFLIYDAVTKEDLIEMEKGWQTASTMLVSTE